MNSVKDKLLQLTSNFIQRPDLIQGPGGNTSVKSDSGQMMIKASGYRFDEMNSGIGISFVNSKAISQYFFNIIPKNKDEDEKDMLAFISLNILKDSVGDLYPRPSMETGFHAVLDSYVVHTHSVWSNLVNCSVVREVYLEKLRLMTGLEIASIPFVSPGFGLSYLITQCLKEADQNNQKRPEIFFLANHGIIAHSKDEETCTKNLMLIDKVIQDLFDLNSSSYPNVELTEASNQWIPKTDFVNEILSKYRANSSFFEQVLFPDQIVFFSNQISFSGAEVERKIQISDQFKVSYQGTYRDVLSVHETLTAYLFIYDTLQSNSIQIDLIGGQEIDYINQMDMEKHRKQIKIK